MISIWLTAIRI